VFDVFIANGLVVDGSGLLQKEMHVGITGDIVAYVGPKPRRAKKVIDAQGLVVAPGFVDTHAHSEFTLLADGRAEAKIAQGVTTEVNGNCGLSAAPLYGECLERREADLAELGIADRWHTFGEYFSLLETRGIALNFATLCGLGNVRASVIGYENRPASSDEVAIMQDMVAHAIYLGARGISTGLIYPPGIFTTKDEIVALAQAARMAVRGQAPIYASHMRSEGDALLEAVDEAIGIGTASGLAVHLSHLKTAGEANWHKRDAVIARIKTEFHRRMRITADRYPYVASSTDLDTVLPRWVHDGGVKQELARLLESGARRQILSELNSLPSSAWEGIQISTTVKEQNSWMEGERIPAIAEKLGKPVAEAVLDILVEEEARTGAIFFSMCEENLQRFLQLPYVMIGSDSSARSFSGVTAKGKPHPRGFGSFPRVLARYVRELQCITLQDAVRRMTSVPAYRFRLAGRGMIQPGFFADIAIFDMTRVEDRADFSNPFQRPSGIAHVLVNGQLALHNGETTGSLSGKILR